VHACRLSNLFAHARRVRAQLAQQIALLVALDLLAQLGLAVLLRLLARGLLGPGLEEPRLVRHALRMPSLFVQELERHRCLAPVPPVFKDWCPQTLNWIGPLVDT